MFRFTIRDVLWLTVVVALGLGWWIEKRQNTPLRDRCARLERLAAMSAAIMREVGIKAEFKEDNIFIAGSRFEGTPIAALVEKLISAPAKAKAVSN
jgi:hypothetical protein